MQLLSSEAANIRWSLEKIKYIIPNNVPFKINIRYEAKVFQISLYYRSRVRVVLFFILVYEIATINYIY